MARRAKTNSVADAATPVTKEYDAYDLIPCQSLVNGTMYYLSPKSNTMYTWDNNGSIVDMTYEDLLVMKQSHSELMYRPCLMIMDEELLSQPRWANVKSIYDNYDVLSLGDATKIISLDSLSLKKALDKLTPSMRVVICNTAATMIENGTLDSIAKIKVIDEVCGTELYSLAFK